MTHELISWCRTRISQLREQPESLGREARLEELTHVVIFVQGLEVLQKLRERDEPDYEGIAIEAIRGAKTWVDSFHDTHGRYPDASEI